MNTPTWDPLYGGSITPSVHDEFGTLKTAILSPIATPALYANASGLSIDLMKAEFEKPHHNAKHKVLYGHQKFLMDRGVRIVHPHHPHLQPTMQNMATYIGYDMYCRDFLGVVDDTAILSTLAPYRNHVRGHYQRIMEQIPENQQAQCQTSFSWGNALLTHQGLMVGLEHPDYLEAMYKKLDYGEFSEILNSIDARNDGIRTMRHILTDMKSMRQLAICALTLNTDLDTAFAPLPRKSRTSPRQAIIASDQIHPESIATLRRSYKLIGSPDSWEKLGCNILWLDPETPLVSAEATKTIALLRSLHFNVQTRAVGPLKSHSIGDEEGQEGGWRCVTGVLERANDYDFD